MKVFSELVFAPHPNAALGGIQALMFFPNGFGVSVIADTQWSRPGLYGLAVLMGDVTYSEIIDSRTITPNNLEYLTPRQVSDYMCKVQETRVIDVLRREGDLESI